MVWQCRSYSGRSPSHVGVLGGVGLQGNGKARPVVLARLMSDSIGSPKHLAVYTGER